MRNSVIPLSIAILFLALHNHEPVEHVQYSTFMYHTLIQRRNIQGYKLTVTVFKRMGEVCQFFFQKRLPSLPPFSLYLSKLKQNKTKQLQPQLNCRGISSIIKNSHSVNNQSTCLRIQVAAVRSQDPACQPVGNVRSVAVRRNPVLQIARRSDRA